MIVTILQILFVLLLLIVVIGLVFRSRQEDDFTMPENYEELLLAYVPFYAALTEGGRQQFNNRLKKFLLAVKITGANADVEDLDRVLIGAAALIPVFYIPDWEYINLREVLLYPGHFTQDFDQHSAGRTIAGMVGNGPMQNMMILSNWELRQDFINRSSVHNTAIHEFVHLIDGMDGTLDGVPELLLERKHLPTWKALLEQTMAEIRAGHTDINAYGATGPVECFAVIAEYFFNQPEAFGMKHPELNRMLQLIFIRRI